MDLDLLQVGYTPDYLFLLQTILRSDPQVINIFPENFFAPNVLLNVLRIVIDVHASIIDYFMLLFCRVLSILL